MNAGYQAVREGGAGLIDLSSRGRIRVGGTEAVMFLNGLVTNDMKTLGENRWMPAAFPTVQGRLIGAVRVMRTGDSFLIDTDRGSHEAVLKSISRFTLAGDFKVTDLTDVTAMMSVQGKGAGEIAGKVFGLSNVPRDGVAEVNSVTIIRATHTGEDGFDFVIDSTRGAELRQALIDAGAVAVDDETFEVLRVEAGIPVYDRDMDDSNVVIETNLDDAVSYTKGCYVGQEIIVRIKHRGHVAKKLTGLRVETGEKSQPEAVLKSTVFSPKLNATIALGYVRHEHLAPGTVLSNGVVAELPFVRGSWYEN